MNKHIVVSKRGRLNEQTHYSFTFHSIAQTKVEGLCSSLEKLQFLCKFKPYIECVCGDLVPYELL